MSELETERLRFRSTLAALRFQLTLVGAELKYRAGQSRLPKGQTGGGRFADEGRGSHGAKPGGGSSATAAKPLVQGAAAVARAAMANPEAAIVAGAAAAPLSMGVVGISRAAGLATQLANGGVVTPMLHIPFSVDLGPTNSRGGGISRYISPDIRAECAQQYDQDAEVRRSLAGYNKRRRQICWENAANREAECIAGGGTRATHTHLLPGVR